MKQMGLEIYTEENTEGFRKSQITYLNKEILVLAKKWGFDLDDDQDRKNARDMHLNWIDRPSHKVWGK
jgi:hypothetical protein